MDVVENLESQLLAAVPTPLAVFDRNARLIGFNPAYAALTGLDAGWLAGKPAWNELNARLQAARQLPEVADPRAWREHERRKLVELARAASERLYLPDGRTLVRMATPLPHGGFVLAFEDVTPRLAAERAANEAAQVQRRTLDHLSDALAVFGPDGRLQFANAAFAAMWSWTGERLADFLAHAAMTWPVARVLARDSETMRIERDGRILEAQHLPLPDGAALMRFSDVTAGAQLEDALRARAEATDAANRMKSEFVATLAHEARTPLTSIAGFAALLAGGNVGTLSRRQADYAQAIATAAEHLSRLVDDVLDLAEIEAGMAPLDTAPFDLHAALATLAAAVTERARTNRVALDFDCPPGIGFYDGDVRRIRQAVLHLLGNAITYTPPGGRVSLSAKRTDGAIEIVVADTGIGIARDELARVPEPFARGHDADGAGAGLGLALVRRFVGLHGGALRLSSIKNRGTTAVLHLPVSGASG